MVCRRTIRTFLVEETVFAIFSGIETKTTERIDVVVGGAEYVEIGRRLAEERSRPGIRVDGRARSDGNEKTVAVGTSEMGALLSCRIRFVARLVSAVVAFDFRRRRRIDRMHLCTRCCRSYECVLAAHLVMR